MKKVKLYFKITLNDFSDGFVIFYIEHVNILNKIGDYQTGTHTFEHTFDEFDVTGKLSIDLAVQATQPVCFDLEVSVNDNPLPGSPFSLCADPKTLIAHFRNSYTV